MTITKEALLTKRPMPTRDVDVPGLGAVQVRSLTRAEVFAFQSAPDPSKLETKMLAAALLAPKLTEAEAEEWAAASPADEITPVIDAILELSGMKEGADKEAMKSFRAKPGQEV